MDGNWFCWDTILLYAVRCSVMILGSTHNRTLHQFFHRFYPVTNSTSSSLKNGRKKVISKFNMELRFTLGFRQQTLILMIRECFRYYSTCIFSFYATLTTLNDASDPLFSFPKVQGPSGASTHYDYARNVRQRIKVLDTTDKNTCVDV